MAFGCGGSVGWVVGRIGTYGGHGVMDGEGAGVCGWEEADELEEGDKPAGPVSAVGVPLDPLRQTYGGSEGRFFGQFGSNVEEGVIGIGGLAVAIEVAELEVFRPGAQEAQARRPTAERSVSILPTFDTSRYMPAQRPRAMLPGGPGFVPSF